MKNIGVAIAGAGGKRQEHDFYRTPVEAIVALLPWLEHWPQSVWEPACGDGAISEVLRERGFHVFSSDIVNRGYGGTIQDFLTVEPMFCAAQAIVTNPPFNKAIEFIKQARRLKIEYLALLLKIQFWNAASRLVLFNEWTPSRILPLTWRLDFDGRGAPTMDCMWCLWEPDRFDGMLFQPIARPESEVMRNARSARERVEEWSPAKQDYAERIVAELCG